MRVRGRVYPLLTHSEIAGNRLSALMISGATNLLEGKSYFEIFYRHKKDPKQVKSNAEIRKTHLLKPPV